MAAKPLPSQEVLRQLLDYDPETGVLRWKERSRDWFKTTRQYKTWNTRYAGKQAICHVDIQGYSNGSILGINYRAHRVAWKFVTGQDPEIIDHINGDRSDNRLSNFRDVDSVGNGKNQRLRKDSSSGVSGVCWGRHVNKWMAYIGMGGREGRKRIHLGVFDDFADAVMARRKAEVDMGFLSHFNEGKR